MLMGTTALFASVSPRGAADMRDVMVGRRRAARIIWKADMMLKKDLRISWTKTLLDARRT